MEFSVARVVGLAAALAVALAGCGTEPDRRIPASAAGGTTPSATPNATTSATPGGTDERPAPAGGLEVLTPADGATVTLPFEVTVATAAELGPIDDELHHLHIWFGDEGDYTLHESGTVNIGTAPAGATTMYVQVHTHTHDPVTDPVATSLTVEAGPGGDTGGADTGGGDPGYTY